MKAKRKSAGILLYRFRDEHIQLFLVHPGGPFWANKDQGAWTIPKGEFQDGEEPLITAKREFFEETGKALSGNFIELTPILQKAGKLVYAYATQGDLDEKKMKSNTYKVEWPPKSGKWKSYPEVDKGDWFSVEESKKKINAAQIAFVDELLQKLNGTELL